MTLTAEVRDAFVLEAPHISSSEDLDSLADEVYKGLPEDTKEALSRSPFQGVPYLRSAVGLESTKDVTDALLYVAPFIYSENDDDLLTSMEEYRQSAEYTALEVGANRIVDESFKLCLQLREELLPVFLSSYSSTRMSPGDRMVWSEAVSQMRDCQKKASIKIIIHSIEAVAKGAFKPWSLVTYPRQVVSDYHDYMHCK